MSKRYKARKMFSANWVDGRILQIGVFSTIIEDGDRKTHKVVMGTLERVS